MIPRRLRHKRLGPDTRPKWDAPITPTQGAEHRAAAEWYKFAWDNKTPQEREAQGRVWDATMAEWTETKLREAGL